MEKVGIVILNYKGWKDTIECLESVFKLNFHPFEVVVVDNWSGDDSIEKITDWANGKLLAETNELHKGLVFPPIDKPVPLQVLSNWQIDPTDSTVRLTIIKNKLNNGYAGGNNIGIEYLLKKGITKYFWLLNNDTVVHPDALMHMVHSMEDANHKIGIVGSKLLLYNFPTVIQNIGNTYNKWLAFSKEIALNETDSGQYERDHVIPFVTGASMLISKKFMEDVGLMAEEYFLYFEEADWGIRAFKKGWFCKFSAGSKVYHKVGSSTGGSADKSKKSEMVDFYYFRNKILITKKFYPFCLITVYLSFLIAIFNRVKRKQFDRIPMLLKILINPYNHYKDLRN